MPSSSTGGHVSYTLYYFDIRGRGEVIRLILEYVGADYEEQFAENWPVEKPHTQFGQLPILIIKEAGQETQLAQTPAIVRYLTQRYGLLPREPLQIALLDAFYQSWEDLLVSSIHLVKLVPEEQKAVALQQLKASLEPMLKGHTHRLCQNGNRGVYWGAGDTLTYVDMQAVASIDIVNHIVNCVQGQLLLTANMAPELFKVYDRVRSEPRIQAYLSSSRRLQEFHPDRPLKAMQQQSSQGAKGELSQSSKQEGLEGQRHPGEHENPAALEQKQKGTGGHTAAGCNRVVEA